MNTFAKILSAFVLILIPASCVKESQIHLVTTGDVHGAWFDESYVEDGAVRPSIMAVKHYVDSLRASAGRRNVILLEDGDCLQGDNASYYFNYVETQGEHLYSRMASYMGYDAAVVGNHDIETGHDVYDKVFSELKKHDIAWLAGNAVKTDSGEPYFPACKIMKKGGVKVAVLGFTNPHMKAWLSESAWSGMDFLSLIPLVQEWVDKVRDAERPDVVIVGVHAGTGSGDGLSLESQGLDLLKTLKGVDVIVTSHDHRPCVEHSGDTWLINGGAKAANAGHAVIGVRKKGRKVESVSVCMAEVVNMDKNLIDEDMKKLFYPDFVKVKEFTNRHVGEIAMDLATRDAYKGMSDYVNLVHTVQISVPEAEISIAAPLTFNGFIGRGELVYNDMFSIYPYENQLFVLSMTGEEIRKFLEFSYDNWIVTPGSHVLKMNSSADPRTGTSKWSFAGRPYNFDSAAGLVYTVDVTKPYGSRISISSLAGGKPFDPEASYNVAMTSYRANGGGDTIIKGAGIPKEEIESRIVARYPEIRELVYQYISGHKTITPGLVGDRAVIGEWRFVPEKIVGPLMEADMNLIF